MERPPGVPAEFDVLTVVFLVRPPEPPEFSDADLERLQLEHLAYGFDLGNRGITVANGPLVDQSDPAMRGMTVYAVGATEALAIARADPMVRAGRLQAHVARWWTGVGKIDFPEHDGGVADRQRLEDMHMR